MAKKKETEKAVVKEYLTTEKATNEGNSEVVKECLTTETTIYIGKSLPSLPQFTIFKDGVLPAHVEELASSNDAVRGLIVPVSKLQESRTNSRKKGNILNYYINKQ